MFLTLTKGTHTVQCQEQLDALLSGAPLIVATFVLRARGAVNVVVDAWGIPLSIEPPDIVWQHDLPELFDRIDEMDERAILQSSAPASVVAARFHLTVLAVNEFRAANPSAARVDQSRRLTPFERDEIALSSEANSVLARRFGVSRQAIHAIKRKAA
jgi:hypothetical protein